MVFSESSVIYLDREALGCRCIDLLANEFAYTVQATLK